MTEELPGHETARSIREGDSNAFRQVFDACYVSLCQYAFTLLRDADEAEDTVQSMFAKLWERREELQIQQDVRSYLFRSVYNHCMNQLEHRIVKNKYQQRTQYDLSGAAQQPSAFENELEDQVKKIIDALPPQCRTIFIMSRYEGLQYSEIAEKLGISVNTIQNQICKALKIVRDKLQDATGD